MRRLQDWPQRLARAINERTERPHVWGQNDCALYVADLVAAVTGEDIGAQFRGLYDDEEGAAALLEANGWGDLGDLADAWLPPRSDRPRRGDVVLQAGRHGPYLGVCWQGGVIAAGPRRPIIWPRVEILKAWSVG